MPHVVVTGGAGFIGSHVVDAYIRRGWKVTVVDNLSTGVRGNVNPSAEIVEGDVTDPRTIAAVIREGVDVVNHHAAQMDVRRSVADPAYDAEQNILASLRILSRAAEVGLKRFIFASSGGAAYGEPKFAPQTEDHPFAPMSPYGIAKLSVEYYLNFFREVHGIATTALRYGNVFGPRQRKDGEAGVVAIFGGKMLADEEITINGDGQQTRDYIFVGDVVRANMGVSESQELTGGFNVGTGVETSVVQLAETMSSILGRPLEAQHAKGKAGEQRRSVLDGTKLRRAAGLPEPVALRDGLTRTMEWLRTGGTGDLGI